MKCFPVEGVNVRDEEAVSANEGRAPLGVVYLFAGVKVGLKFPRKRALRSRPVFPAVKDLRGSV